MMREEFERAVREAVGRLPRRFKVRLENVEVVIAEGTGRGRRLGLYEGVPRAERGEGYSGVMPDRITLFRREIEAECKAHGLDLREEIARVIRHEVAHHFGISDGRLEDLGAY